MRHTRPWGLAARLPILFFSLSLPLPPRKSITDPNRHQKARGGGGGGGPGRPCAFGGDYKLNLALPGFNMESSAYGSKEETTR
jgi:hypothetical protein